MGTHLSTQALENELRQLLVNRNITIVNVNDVCFRIRFGNNNRGLSVIMAPDIQTVLYDFSTNDLIIGLGYNEELGKKSFNNVDELLEEINRVENLLSLGAAADGKRKSKKRQSSKRRSKRKLKSRK